VFQQGEVSLEETGRIVTHVHFIMDGQFVKAYRVKVVSVEVAFKTITKVVKRNVLFLGWSPRGVNKNTQVQQWHEGLKVTTLDHNQIVRLFECLVENHTCIVTTVFYRYKVDSETFTLALFQHRVEKLCGALVDQDRFDVAEL